MTIYEFVDKLLVFLELGTWNGNRIIPRGLLGPQEQILLGVINDSLRDWRRQLSGQQRQFREPMIISDFDDFRRIQFEHFSVLRKNYSVGRSYSAHDLALAERLMRQSLRIIKESYLERA